MNLTEFLRRAAFAAEKDPSILTLEGVEEAEAEYKTYLGPSPWTRDNDHS